MVLFLRVAGKTYRIKGKSIFIHTYADAKTLPCSCSRNGHVEPIIIWPRSASSRISFDFRIELAENVWNQFVKGTARFAFVFHMVIFL